MKIARAPQLSGRPALHGHKAREVRKHVCLALSAGKGGQGPSDRENRQARNEAEQAARHAHREERRRRNDARFKIVDGAVRKPSTPGLAFTVAVTAGVFALAEVLAEAEILAFFVLRCTQARNL